jgi:predicted N-acetyltransferase YhbS
MKKSWMIGRQGVKVERQGVRIGRQVIRAGRQKAVKKGWGKDGRGSA